MTTTAKPHQACVQFADPNAPDGVQVSPAAFLKGCRQSALVRFRSSREPCGDCLTIEHPVPPKPGDKGSTGLIVAHVSSAVSSAWETDPRGTPRQKRAHVESQVHLALEDLADQDMHGYLAITKEQCAIYDPDLNQLLNEALDRTTFNHLGRAPDPHWEGTLVQSVEPPFLVLVVSIGFADKAKGRPRARPTKSPPAS